MLNSIKGPFVRRKFSALKSESKENKKAICSVLQLIEHNAEENPNHVFCLQAEKGQESVGLDSDSVGWNVRRISFKDLYHAVADCCSWLRNNLVGSSENSLSVGQSPVAVYLESDVTLFLFVVAITALNHPILLLSARLSSDNVGHLLKQTGAKNILVSTRTRRTVESYLENDITVTTVPGYAQFLDGTAKSAANTSENNWPAQVVYDEDDPNVIILHSSGTTGLPKPIRLGHRYLLGYAACHTFPEECDATWPNLSTLPLYHGFGMLAPCLSLSIGMCCCFPPSTIIPGAQSTIELLSLFRACSLMSVPSIMEDVVNLEVSQRKMALSSLANLKYVAIGGGPLKPSVGKILHDASVNLLNHYGATEIGAIAPIFVPSSDYDWRYLRLRGDLGLELQPISDSPGAPDKLRYKLVGYPFGWKSAFELQDEIEKRPLNQTEHTDIRVLGRKDDLRVLKTGEKISPRSIEDSLVLDPNIKSAVCLGEGFFELILLVEPSASSLMDAKDFRNHVWNLLSAISPTLDSHSRISSIEGIVIKDGEKTIPRSDKGSIMRKEVHKLFEREIEEAYKRLEAAAIGGEIHVDASSVEGTLAATIEVIMGTKLQSLPLSPDQDFFELGMDSLEAARLARALTFVLPPLGFQRDVQITKEFVYKYPTISKLAQVCHDMGGSHLDTLIPKVTRRVKIQQLADEYLGNIEADATNIVLTGSSGNLGIHMLSCLLRSPRVHKVVCLGRGGPSAAKALRQRQEAARVAAGIEIKSIEWNKVVNVGANMGTTYLGLAKEQYEEVVASTTHIIHLAWPMDFNRQLESYRPQLESLRGLIRLAVDINRANPIVRPGLLFASSISVVRHYPNLTGQHVIPEISMRNPDVTAHIGYAEAKWICEQMLERVKQKLGHKIDPIVVRIGQLSGPESSRGVWKTEEHIPALLKASQRVAAFPAIGGDFSWLPVDRAAKCLMDIVLRQSSSSCSSPTSTMYLHLENPMRQSFADLGAIATRELSLSGGIVPFDSWLQLLARRGDTPGLLDFFRNDFRDLANGSVKLGMRNGLSVSTSLRSSSGLSQSLMIEYIDRWRQTGFLS